MTEQHKTDEHATSKGTAPGTAPLVAVVMGSTSDWETMRHASEVLGRLEVPHTCQVVSAHRTPERLAEFGKSAAGRGIQVIVAGAGGAAHLPGMIAANTHLPVFGVPVMSEALRGRLAPLDRPDAARRARWDFGHRRARCVERRLVGCERALPDAAGVAVAPDSVP